VTFYVASWLSHQRPVWSSNILNIYKLNGTPVCPGKCNSSQSRRKVLSYAGVGISL